MDIIIRTVTYCVLLRSSRMSQTQVVVDTDTLAVEQREREMRQLEVSLPDYVLMTGLLGRGKLLGGNI